MVKVEQVASCLRMSIRRTSSRSLVYTSAGGVNSRRAATGIIPLFARRQGLPSKDTPYSRRDGILKAMKPDKQQFDAVLTKLLAAPASANEGSRTAHRPKQQ